MTARKAWSIRKRLISSWLLMLVLVGSVVYLVTGEVAKRALQRGQDSDLQAVAQVILDSVVSTSEGPVFELPYSAFEVLAYSAPERVFYRVSLGDTVLAGYDDLPPPVDAIASLSFFSQIYRGEATRFVRAKKPIRPGSTEIISVMIAQTQASYLAFANQVANGLALAVLLSFLVLAVWLEWSLRHSLKPFRAIEHDLAHRSPDDFAPVVADTPAEVERLVQGFNHTLDQHRELLEKNRALIAEATHQIKTPIAAMMTAAEILEKRISKDEKPFARDLVVRARYASKLVTQLLTRASLAYREMLSIQEPVNLQALVEGVVRTLDASAEAREVGLSVIDSGESLEVLGDRVAIREAIVCLVDNAIQHTPVLSEVVVQVALYQGQACVSVCDNGPGLPPEQLADSWSSNVSPSLHRGHGLSIARRVAESHGGSLKLTNRPDGGAQCRLILG